jgi:cell division ATPase FtsA
MNNQYKKDQEDLERAVRDFKKYKQLREEYRRLLLKPKRYPLDPERIKEDLSGNLSSEDFFKGLLD